MRDDDLDPVAVDAAAAEPFIAVVISAVGSVVVRRRPVVQAGAQRRWSAVQPGFQRRTVVEPGRRAGIAVPDTTGERWRERLVRQYGEQQCARRQYFQRVVARRPARQPAGGWRAEFRFGWRRSIGGHAIRQRHDERPIRKQRFERPSGGWRTGVHHGFADDWSGFAGSWRLADVEPAPAGIGGRVVAAAVGIGR
jgi:hypothetical protein